MTLFIHLVIHTLSSGCSCNFIYSVYNACNHNYEKKREMKSIVTLFLTIITCSLLLLVRSSSLQQCAISGMNCPSNSVFDEDQCACLCLDGFKVGEDPSNPESIICREVSSATTQSTECPGGRVLVRGACVCPVICPQFFTVAQECTCSGPVCPKNTIWNGVSKTCICDTSVCGPNSIQNSDCSCTCNSGFVPGNKLYLRNTFWCRKPSDPECPDGSAIPIGHSECACTPGLCEGNSINEFSSSGTTCTCNTCGNPDISIVSVKNNVEQCVPRCEGLAKFNSESQQCECNTVCGQGSTLTERCSCKCNKGYAPLDASQSECQLYTSCRPGYSFNADTQRCEKDNVVMESCPLGVSQDKDGFCICINKCGSNQELTPTCGCTCKAGTINSTNVDGESKCMAACPDGVLYNRYWSECMCSNSCGANEKHDNDCNCVCSPGFHLQTNENGEKRCMEQCKPNYFYSADWSTCICSQQQQCRSDQIAGGECGCTCREGEYEMTNILGETKCMPNCPFLHMKYDMSWSKCECDNQCGLNQYREDDCSCSCKPGFVWALNTKSQPGCALKCKINEVHDENFQCVCTTGTDKVTNVNGDMNCMPKCPGSKVYDPSWQQCVCPNSCPDSFVRDDDTCDCVCQDLHLKPFKNTIGQESCQVPCNTNEEYDENWKCKCKDGFTKVTENGLCTSIVIAKVAVTAEQLPPYFNADGTRTLIGDVYLTNVHNIAEFLVEKERTEEAILLDIVIKAREKVERLERLLRELKEKARILYQEIQILRLILELIPQLSDKETASDSLQVMTDLTVQVEKEYKLVLEAIERTERELVIAREELAIAEANYWADASMRHYTLNVADVAKQRIARVDSDRLFMKNILYNTDRNSKTYTCTSCDVQLYGCELSEAVIVKDPHTGCEVCQCKPIIPRQLREYNVQIGLLPDGTQVLPNEKIFEHIRPADLRVSAELQKELDRDPSLPRSSAQ